MQLTIEQQTILKDFNDFLESDIQIFILKGYAGTGKTTMVKNIVECLTQKHRVYKLMSPTGRAAKVLKDKTGFSASTIHRAIYSGKLHVKDDEPDNYDKSKTKFKYYFPLVDNATSAICIVDEASMVSSRKTNGELFEFGSGIILDDLMRFVGRNKAVFVGDPAQLPPVGDNQSKALETDYFISRGLKVVEHTLTTVMRQTKDSLILDNATRIRSLICSPLKNNLCLSSDGRQVEEIPSENIVREYCRMFPKPALGNSVIICYTNTEVDGFNYDVRMTIFNGDVRLHVGDVLMVHRNHYDQDRTDAVPHDLMNGEFVQVGNLFDNTEIRHIHVFDEGAKVCVELKFRDADIITEYGSTFRVKILENFLDVSPNYFNKDADIEQYTRNTNATLVQKALFIDFCIRNKELSSQSEEFRTKLKADHYYNSLHVKYGYAITGHKSQGGEWGTSFVSYPKLNLSDDRLRWYYTATTRAKDKLLAINMPHVTQMSKLNMEPVTGIRRKLVVTSGPDDIHDITSKLEEAKRRLAKIGAEIVFARSMQYQEMYTVRYLNADYRVSTYYNGKMVFKPFTIVGTPNDNAKTIIDCLNKEGIATQPVTTPDYVPTNDTMATLYDLMKECCDKTGVGILEVTEDLPHYNVVYSLKTDSEYSQITFFVNAKGFVTYGKPQSCTALLDNKLVELANILSSKSLLQ